MAPWPVPVLSLAALLAQVPGGGNSARPDPPPPGASPKGAVAPEEPAGRIQAASGTAASAPPAVSRLFLVVSADPFQTDGELKARVGLAARHVDPNTEAQITVKPIPRSAYVELAKLISKGNIADERRAGEIEVEPYTEDSALWVVTTGPDLYLTSMELTFRDEKEKPRTYQVAEKSKTEADLRFYRPGQYLLRLPSGAVPKSAVLTLEKPGAPARKVNVEWPLTDRHFVISLENFRKDAQLLTDALMNSNIVGTPFKSIGTVEPMSLVLADLKAVVGTERVGWNGNTFQATLRGLNGPTTSRVWVLFPLTQEQADRELASIASLIGQRGASSGELSKNIRTRRAPAATPEGYVMRAGAEPMWYEMPGSDEKGFQAKWKLEAIDEWRASKKPLGDHWILVYEFGPDSQEGAGCLCNPVQKDAAPGGAADTSPVYAKDRAIPEWPAGIRQQLPAR